MSDGLLFGWLLLSVLWDFVVFGFVAYRVFWRGNSGLWFISACLLCESPTLLKALRKRFGIPEATD